MMDSKSGPHELFKTETDDLELKKVVSHEKDGMTLLLSNLGLLNYFEDNAFLHMYEAGNLQHLATTISIMDAIPSIFFYFLKNFKLVRQPNVALSTLREARTTKKKFCRTKQGPINMRSSFTSLETQSL